jgi:hypothetical protein
MPSPVAPPYSKNAAAKLSEAILQAIDGSEQQVYISEIKELDAIVKSTLEMFQQVNVLLLEEDAYVNTPRKFTLQAANWTEEMKVRHTNFECLKCSF